MSQAWGSIMNEETRKLGVAIARQLYAMVSKRKDKDLASNLATERYQRTFTDEYLFRRNARPGFKKVPVEQKVQWEALMAEERTWNGSITSCTKAAKG